MARLENLVFSMVHAARVTGLYKLMWFFQIPFYHTLPHSYSNKIHHLGHFLPLFMAFFSLMYLHKKVPEDMPAFSFPTYSCHTMDYILTFLCFCLLLCGV